MASCRVLLLFAGMLGLTAQFNVVKAELSSYTLGFLTPAAASEIPTSLATEWDSAFRVAVEVLNSKQRPYRLIPYQEYSDCDWQKAYHGADVMVRLDPATYPQIIGVVGPACSGAAMGSSSVLATGNISMVSFAATAEPISVDREWFYNLFRTVYSDKYQGQAIAASIAKLNMTAVTILHTQQYYSMNLAQNINESVNGAIPVSMVMLENGENSTIDYVQLKTVLDSHDPETFVILVMHPQEAHDTFSALDQQGRLDSPWWYFGTDGVTALDPADESSSLVSKLVGEIGLAPYGGDYSNASVCQEYYTYWQNAGYPGLPVSGVSKTRSYTPYLIDTVRLYFEICDNLVKANVSITPLNVLNTLKTSPPSFQGCTGLVAIDPATGSRSITLQPPIYDLVSMTADYWENVEMHAYPTCRRTWRIVGFSSEIMYKFRNKFIAGVRKSTEFAVRIRNDGLAKGRIENSKFLTLQQLSRPNGQPASNSAQESKNKKTGTIVGTLFGLLAAAGLVGLGAYLYKKKLANHYNPTSFVRMAR